MKLDIRAVELLCSRLCHDLVGPVAAVNNGMELMAELGGGGDPETLALIGESGRATADRLRFFRLAYGLAGGEGLAMTPAEMCQATAAVLAERKVTLAWRPLPAATDPRLPPRAAKVVLNLLLLAAEALPRGGEIDLVAGGGTDGAFEASLAARGPGARLEDATGAALAGEVAPEALTARTVHAYFTGRLAAAAGGGVDSAVEAAGVRFQARLPAGA